MPWSGKANDVCGELFAEMHAVYRGAVWTSFQRALAFNTIGLVGVAQQEIEFQYIADERHGGTSKVECESMKIKQQNDHFSLVCKRDRAGREIYYPFIVCVG